MMVPRSRFGLRDDSTRPVVCVQGLGFVGAAMAAAVAAARDHNGRPCFDVIGVELDTPNGHDRASRVASGRFPFASADPEIGKAVEMAHNAGNLGATTDHAAFGLASIAIVDVHLDVATGDKGEPTALLADFEKAIATLGRELPAGALVIVETTVPPGTCERVVAPVLARELAARGMPADALLLAHSYERVMPGPDYFSSIVNFWRVYAGHTPEAGDACGRFLSGIVNVQRFPLRRLASTTASELAKVMENSYRAINIALVEEWARYAENSGVDLFEIIDAIRDRPTHNNIRQPGFGVGGYCLTKDPLFAEAAVKQFRGADALTFPFCRSAVEINRQMPIANLDRIERLAGSVKGKSILLLGVAYRSEVADTRYSPAEIFFREASRRSARLRCHDPYVREWSELGMTLPEQIPDPLDSDIVVFAVPHRAYRELDVVSWLGGARPLIYDCDNVLKRDMRAALRQAGIRVESTGRGIGL